MSIFRKIIIWCVIACPSAGFADTLLTNPISDRWHLVLGLSGGPAWTQAGETQTFFLQPDVEKSYVAKKNNQALGSGELFLGVQKNLHSSATGQIGIAVAGATAVKLTGNILEDADPSFNNFNYAYKINHAYLGLKGRLIAGTMYGLQPYLSGSAGVGFNRAYNFSISPIISEEVPAPAFTANTNAAFSYTLGIGLQKSLSANWQLGVGYEFADWGSYDLGAASGQTLNQGLSLDHVYVQQLQFTVIYID